MPFFVPKIPVVWEAYQLTATANPYNDWPDEFGEVMSFDASNEWYVEDEGGDLLAVNVGEWVVKDWHGNFHVMTDEDFQAQFTEAQAPGGSSGSTK